MKDKLRICWVKFTDSGVVKQATEEHNVPSVGDGKILGGTAFVVFAVVKTEHSKRGAYHILVEQQ